MQLPYLPPRVLNIFFAFVTAKISQPSYGKFIACNFFTIAPPPPNYCFRVHIFSCWRKQNYCQLPNEVTLLPHSHFTIFHSGNNTNIGTFTTFHYFYHPSDTFVVNHPNTSFVTRMHITLVSSIIFTHYHVEMFVI